MANWSHDPTGIKSRSTSAISHIVGGASGFTGGAGKSGRSMPGKSDPPAGFHGRSTAAVSHKTSSGPTKKMGSRLK
jgi:hypothetical protein